MPEVLAKRREAGWICTSCRKWKPAAEFYANNTAASGRRSWCKGCDDIFRRWHRMMDTWAIPESMAHRCLEEEQELRCPICRGTLSWEHHLAVAENLETNEVLGFVHRGCRSRKLAPEAWMLLEEDPPMRRANRGLAHIPADFFYDQGELF